MADDSSSDSTSLPTISLQSPSQPAFVRTKTHWRGGLASERTSPEDNDAADRPTVPSSPADWEAKKEIIGSLYMTQNLILNDVMKIMLTEHKFKATARMYKGQFSKWRWSKYNKSGHPPAKSSRNLPRRRGTTLSVITKPTPPRSTTPSPSSILNLLFFNAESLELEATLTAYASYITSWSSTPFPHPPHHHHSVLQTIRTALDYFALDQPSQGGLYLRKAFLQIEDALSTLPTNIEAIWDCCLAVPQLVLNTGWMDILLIFTRYLHHLTALRNPNHPVAAVSRGVFQLAHRDPKQLGYYVERGWKLWVDVITHQRGREDHVTIHLKRGYVILQTPEEEIVRTLVCDFGRCVELSLEERGMVETTRRVLELERLLGRMYLPLFTSESTERAEGMLMGILGRVGRDKEWGYLDRYLCFSAYHFLATIADYKGEETVAREYRRRSLESPKDGFWCQMAGMLEEYLRGEGRIEEAEGIGRERRGVESVVVGDEGR
ncbi:hypothetical protein OQA88_5190 [Cercophora sp. LCS_1]